MKILKDKTHQELLSYKVRYEQLDEFYNAKNERSAVQFEEESRMLNFQVDQGLIDLHIHQVVYST